MPGHYHKPPAPPAPKPRKPPAPKPRKPPTDPNYQKLPWKTRMRYDEAMKGGDPTKKKNKSKFKRDSSTSANER